MSKGRRKEVNRLDELVDIGDSSGEGVLELVERALDDGAVAVSGIALGFSSFGIDLTLGGGGDEVVGVTSASGTGVATSGEIALDAWVLLGRPVFRALGVLLLGLGLGVSLTLDGLVESLVGGQDGVALTTFGETLVGEDLGVVLKNEVKATLHLAAGNTAVATESLVVGLGFSVGAACLGAGHAGVATQSLTTLGFGLGAGVGVAGVDGVDGGGEGVLDGTERRAGLVASHAGITAKSLARLDLRFGKCEGVGDGLSCTLGLVAGHARVAAETLPDLWRWLGISESAGREGEDGEDGAGDLHDDGTRLVVVDFFG